MTKIQWHFESTFISLYLVATEVALEGVHFRPDAAVPISSGLDFETAAGQLLGKTAQQLNEYIEGRRTVFELPLNAPGTPFQQRVWQELSLIPFGQTTSYSAIARRIKNDKAVRAVGTANGRNPLAIIVPCHRVIAADGTLGGYAGGLPAKLRLLELEKRIRGVQSLAR